MLGLLAPTALPPARRRLVLAGCLLIAYSVAALVLAVLYDWPRAPRLEETVPDTVSWSDAVDGTAVSLPLVPLLVLVLATGLARLRFQRGPVGGIVVLGMMGILILSAGTSVFSRTSPLIPQEVLLVAGIGYTVLGLMLSLAAALAMRERLAAARKAAEAEIAEAAARRDVARSQVQDGA